MSKSLISFAIVGCGSIGKRHIAVLDAEPMANLVAICDSTPDALNVNRTVPLSQGIWLPR